MKIASMCLPLLIILVFSLTMGCIGSNPGSSNSNLTNSTRPVSVVTTVSPSADLSDLAITRAEIPFTVVHEEGETYLADMEQNTYGVLRGYSHAYASERSDSPTAKYLVQGISDYPPGNTTLVFNEFKKRLQQSDDPKTSVVWLQDPHIGDESFAMTMIRSSGSVPENPYTTIVFRKANVVEIIMIKTKNADMQELSQIAATAAAKIPANGLNPPAIVVKPSPLPTTTRPTTIIPVKTTTIPTTPAIVYANVVPAVSSLELKGPVTITTSEQNKIKTITFSLQLNPGNRPVDLRQVEYSATTPKGFWSGRYGSAAVRLSGDLTNTLFEEGEVVTVVLDTATLDLTPKTPGEQRVEF